MPMSGQFCYRRPSQRGQFWRGRFCVKRKYVSVRFIGDSFSISVRLRKDSFDGGPLKGGRPLQVNLMPLKVMRRFFRDRF